jgi:hypothetical protein
MGIAKYTTWLTKKTPTNRRPPHVGRHGTSGLKLLDTSGLKVHASKDGIIAAHLTQVGMVQQAIMGSNQLQQMQRRI